MSPRKLKITPAKVLVLLQQHGPQTADELAMRLGWGRDGVPAVEACLKTLEEQHAIGYVGDEMPRAWQLED